MRRKAFILVVIMAVLIGTFSFCQAQEGQAKERIFLLREARQIDKTSVAVEAYLLDDVLEVTVWVRMYGNKPRVDNVNLVGPGIGRLSCKMKSTLFATEEDDGVFAIPERAGMLGLTTKKVIKKPKGALTKELYKFVIPPGKIKSGKRYELRVRIGSMQEGEGVMQEFKFELKDLPDLILR